MADFLSVRADMHKLNSKLFELRSSVIDVAAMRALNKTIAQVKTAASKEIRSAGYNFKAKRIKQQLAVRKASRSKLVASVRASGRPIPLIEFGAKDLYPSGVSAKIKGGTQAYPNAFIVTTERGQGVYVRISNEHRTITTRAGKVVRSAYKIRQLYGPSIPQAFAEELVQSALVRLAKERFPAIYKHELEWARK